MEKTRMTDHIKPEEWIAYFSHETPIDALPELYARVHAHIGTCVECHAVWEHSVRLNETVTFGLRDRTATGSDAYLAVASSGTGSKKFAERNAIEFTVVVSEGKMDLLPEQPAYSGNANKYVFQIEKNRFTEDCNPEMYVETKGEKLTARMSGFDLQLRDEEGEEVPPSCGTDGTVTFTVSVDGLYTLTAEMR